MSAASWLHPPQLEQLWCTHVALWALRHWRVSPAWVGDAGIRVRWGPVCLPPLQTWPLHSKFYTSSLLSKSLTEMLQDECCAMGEALLTALMLLGLRWAPNDVILTYPEKWEGFWGPVYVLTQPYLSTKLGEFVSILAKGINRVLLFPFFSQFY